MATWNSRGLRGSAFEEYINITNDKYAENDMALIQKVPTPITPIEIDQESRHITLAYFDKKSTVDYIGIVQGIPVCFDAKECHEDTFPLHNIHEHQVEFMRAFEKQGGVAFLLLSFTHVDQFYYLTFRRMEEFVRRSEEGGRKSFTRSELDPSWYFTRDGMLPVPYLTQLQHDLDERDA